jgi:uncharacterized protein (TIGR02646 family)
MRYIDRNELISKLPVGWQDDAKNALDELRDVCSKTYIDRRAYKAAKSEIITKYGHIWTALTPILRDLSHDKCWYCETDLGRAVPEIEHFRPKRQVTGHPEHDGYWWLSFSWDNFRLSCAMCNRQRTDNGVVVGKGNVFPLLNEDERVWSEGSVRREKPILIDPCVEHEPGWLYFFDDGRVESRANLPDRATKRVDMSIKTFHLHDEGISKQRRELFRKLSKFVEATDEVAKQAESGDEMALVAYSLARTELRGLISPNGEYSAAARCMLMGMRSVGRPWIDAILQT